MVAKAFDHSGVVLVSGEGGSGGVSPDSKDSPPTKQIFTDTKFWLGILAPIFAYLATKGIDVTPESQTAIIAGIAAIANVVIQSIFDKGIHILPKKNLPIGPTMKDMDLLVESLKALNDRIHSLENPPKPKG